MPPRDVGRCRRWGTPRAIAAPQRSVTAPRPAVGSVGWRQLRAGADGAVLVSFDDGVDWNGLVQSVGGHELLEWQALLVGRFALRHDSRVLLRCSGVRPPPQRPPHRFYQQVYTSGLPPT